MQIIIFLVFGTIMNTKKTYIYILNNDYLGHTKKEVISFSKELILLSDQIIWTLNRWSKYSDYCWFVWSYRVVGIYTDDVVTCMTMNSILSSRALFALCSAWCEVKPREYSVGCESSCMFLSELIRERSRTTCCKTSMM